MLLLLRDRVLTYLGQTVQDLLNLVKFLLFTDTWVLTQFFEICQHLGGNGVQIGLLCRIRPLLLAVACSCLGPLRYWLPHFCCLGPLRWRASVFYLLFGICILGEKVGLGGCSLVVAALGSWPLWLYAWGSFVLYGIETPCASWLLELAAVELVAWSWYLRLLLRMCTTSSFWLFSCWKLTTASRANNDIHLPVWLLSLLDLIFLHGLLSLFLLRVFNCSSKGTFLLLLLRWWTSRQFEQIFLYIIWKVSVYAIFIAKCIRWSFIFTR